jgi:hypothetical protein
MSVNWSKTEFASRLQKVDIPAKDVVVGDIVMFDGVPWGIARIEKQRGRFYFYDEDENGGGGYLGDTLVRILPRSSLAKRAYQ